ncbi:MAG: glycosyltransferase family 39 protein [Myxococcales bacterium]|nr:glycosyltransferase family 39 protein [Myxococcales bacterium]
MRSTERLARIPSLVWATLFAAALVLPGLGSFGFWDPWELNLAERAREMLDTGHAFDVTANGRYAPQPPLDLALSALGMKVFGASEWGGRLLQGLLAIANLLAVYWAGVGLLRRRAALLSVIVLGTMPLFFLQARQLTSDMGLSFSLALSLGGLGRFAWPPTGQRRWRDFAVACVGLVLGHIAGGGLLGIALPCLTLAGTLLATWSLVPIDPKAHPAAGPGEPLMAALTAPGVGVDVPAGSALGTGLFVRGTRGRWPLLVLFALGLVVLWLALGSNVAGQYNAWLGGTPRGGTPSQLFVYFIRQVGFGTFPWSALAVFALGRALVRASGADAEAGVPPVHEQGDVGDRRARLAFVEAYWLVGAGFGFALSTVHVLMVGDARFAVLAPIALALGGFLDEALEAERPQPVLGLLAATGIMILARDFKLVPEDLFSVHLLETLKWPPTMRVGLAPLLLGLVVAVGVYLGLATRTRALAGFRPPAPQRPEGNGRSWRYEAARLYAWGQALIIRVGRYGIHIALGAAVIFALGVCQMLIPRLSHHFSFKPVFESLVHVSKPGDPFGRYRVQGHGIQFYTARQIEEIPSQDRLISFFKSNRRAFCLVNTDDLAALDAAFKTAAVPYVVLDASSSRFLLLSNQTEPGQEDQNPLKRNVWMAPRPPVPISEPGAAAVTYQWPDERPPWTYPVKMSTVFQDAVELIGADFPSSVRRPAKIPLTLYLRVRRRPAPGFKVFVHVDVPGHPRLIGDHEPLAGAFPTSFWLPGEYIRDRTEIDAPLMTTVAGTYTVYIGFWPGGEGQRWRITSGPNDGADRATLGTIQIR